MAGRLLNKSCYRVHNQTAKYFLCKDCSTCFYATPQKGLSVKKSNKLKQRTVAALQPPPVKKVLSSNQKPDYS